MPRVKGYYECKQVGDFFFTEENVAGKIRLSFMCPCGCGILAGVTVRSDGKQIEGAWGWNKDFEKPTTTPSIFIEPSGNHWHGYLTDGIFKSV
jgi:hypothetical protein